MIYEFQNNVAGALWIFSNPQNRADTLILAWQIIWELWIESLDNPS